MTHNMDQSAIYTIRVHGRLGKDWESYFDHMEIRQDTAPDGGPATVLVGCLPDQAALQGTLQKLYSLGLALMSVEKTERSA